MAKKSFGLVLAFDDAKVEFVNTNTGRLGAQLWSEIGLQSFWAIFIALYCWHGVVIIWNGEHSFLLSALEVG
ncbi:hypothetical protein SLE2022_209370 [Rubroshorea leprosula]